MKARILFAMVTVLLCATFFCALAQTSATKEKSPDALVADLYKAHDHKRGPFFQTKSKSFLYAYFEKSLADMIWKDRVTSKNEVGVLDGDPLYDAQDMEIKNFAIGKAESEVVKAKVTVTFENFGQQKTLIFMLGKGSTGWRINDIDYGSEGTLRGWFKQGSK